MWQNNYTITKLFESHEIMIFDSEKPDVVINIIVPSLHDQLNDYKLSKFLSIIERKNIEIFQQSFPQLKIENSLDLINCLVANPLLTNSKEFKFVSGEILDEIKKIIKEVKIDKERKLKVNDYIIDIDL